MPEEENVSLVSIYGNGTWTNINTFDLCQTDDTCHYLKTIMVIYLCILCFGDTLPGNPIMIKPRSKV